MDATLQALGGILLRAVPTFLLVIVLHFYLKSFFFKPFEKMLQRRYEATEGARKIAEQSLERAASKASEYEAAIRAAKAEIYHTDEKLFKQLHEQQAAELLAARQEAEALVKKAKAELELDVETAKMGLAAASDRLADQIAASLLRRSAA